VVPPTFFLSVKENYQPICGLDSWTSRLGHGEPTRFPPVSSSRLTLSFWGTRCWTFYFPPRDSAVSALLAFPPPLFWIPGFSCPHFFFSMISLLLILSFFFLFWDEFFSLLPQESWSAPVVCYDPSFLPRPVTFISRFWEEESSHVSVTGLSRPFVPPLFPWSGC